MTTRLHLGPRRRLGGTVFLLPVCLYGMNRKKFLLYVTRCANGCLQTAVKYFSRKRFVFKNKSVFSYVTKKLWRLVTWSCCWNGLRVGRFMSSELLNYGAGMIMEVFQERERRRGHKAFCGVYRKVKVKVRRLRWSRGSVLPLSTQVRGFKPGRSRQDFSGRKNPQHAFLRKGSKAVGPMSQICGM